MTLQSIIVVCGVAIVGNWLVRRLVRKVDEEPDVDDLPPVQSNFGNSEYHSLLDNYGNRSTGGIPASHLPLDPELVQFVSGYASVVFDEDARPIFDRSLTATPFTENTDYVQIGYSGGEDPALVKRHSLDSLIYRINFDDGNIARPQPYATSIRDYIVKEWLLELDARHAGHTKI